MQLEVKTVLNHIQHFVGFVYQDVRLCRCRGKLRIEARIEPHEGRRARCSECRRPAPGYDRLPERWWLFVPLWGIVTGFLYAPRRVECPEHGVVVEHIPWSEGKRPITTAMMGFLARWRGICRGGRPPELSRPVGRRFTVRWSGLCGGAWCIGSWKASSPLAWTKSTGAKVSGRTPF